MVKKSPVRSRSRTIKETSPDYTAVVEKVKSTGAPLVLEQDGQPTAVVVPYAEYEQLVALREYERKKTWHNEQLVILYQEQAVYERMKPDLLRTHKNRFVAIHNGELVDSDANEELLLERVDSKFGDITILVTQVTETPRVYHVNSPELVRQ